MDPHSESTSASLFSHTSPVLPQRTMINQTPQGWSVSLTEAGLLGDMATTSARRDTQEEFKASPVYSYKNICLGVCFWHNVILSSLCTIPQQLCLHRALYSSVTNVSITAALALKFATTGTYITFLSASTVAEITVYSSNISSECWPCCTCLVKCLNTITTAPYFDV